MKTLAVIAALALLATPALADPSLLMLPQHEAIMVRGGMNFGSANARVPATTRQSRPWIEAVFMTPVSAQVSLVAGLSWHSMHEEREYPSLTDTDSGNLYGFQVGAIFYGGK